MKPGPGLELEAGDVAPLVASGSSIVTRGELRRRADALLDLISSRGVQRVMVRSDDPAQILRAVDATNRAGADLWIAHTNIPEAFVDEMLAQLGSSWWSATPTTSRAATGRRAPRPPAAST